VRVRQVTRDALDARLMTVCSSATTSRCVLIASVGEAERDDPQHPSRGYYESWLVSLGRLLERKQLLES
jgi:hypothetical protein